MDGYMAAAALLPPALRLAAMRLPAEEREACEELRLRRGRRMTALIRGREYGLGMDRVTEDDLRSVLETATCASLHAAGDKLIRGFVPAPGGVRVGVCGTAVMGRSGPEGMRDFSSLALRVPREVPGCADGVWEALTEGGFRSTLIVSTPGGGKTTLLRALIRRLSEAGYRLAVADERGEIADAYAGEPRFDVGPCTDVMSGIPKAEGIEMLLRVMNPQIVAMDEIAGPGDARALLEAVGCGVLLLATAHGESGEPESRTCRRLLDAGAFQRRVWVENRHGERLYTVEAAPCV